MHPAIVVISLSLSLSLSLSRSNHDLLDNDYDLTLPGHAGHAGDYLPELQHVAADQVYGAGHHFPNRVGPQPELAGHGRQCIAGRRAVNHGRRRPRGFGLVDDAA